MWFFKKKSQSKKAPDSTRQSEQYNSPNIIDVNNYQWHKQEAYKMSTLGAVSIGSGIMSIIVYGLESVDHIEYATSELQKGINLLQEALKIESPPIP